MQAHCLTGSCLANKPRCTCPPSLIPFPPSFPACCFPLQVVMIIGFLQASNTVQAIVDHHARQSAAASPRSSPSPSRSPSSSPSPPSHNACLPNLSSVPVSSLLLAFLEFYGKCFDHSTTGLRIRLPPQYCKQQGEPATLENFFPLPPSAPCQTLFIEDPFNPSNNIGQSVFAYWRVSHTFHTAHTVTPPPPFQISVALFLSSPIPCSNLTVTAPTLIPSTALPTHPSRSRTHSLTPPHFLSGAAGADRYHLR